MGRSASKNRTVKRVGAVHRRAKFVGSLYLLGTLLLTALSCVTLFTAPYDGNEIGFFTGIFNIDAGAVSTFWTPLLDGGVSVYLIATVLYILSLLILFINLFASFSQLGALYKNKFKVARPATAVIELARINKKKTAMEKLGKSFSRSFAAFVCLNLLIYIIVPSVAMQMYALIAVGISVVLHLLCGLWGAKVTEFYGDAPIVSSGCSACAQLPHPIYDPRMLASEGVDIPVVRGKLKQEKRENSIWVFFFRNLFQLLAVAGLIISVANVMTLDSDLGKVLSGDASADYVSIALQAVLYLCLCMLIMHATSMTEFNLLGMDGAGMRNFKVFSIFTLIAALAYMAIGIVNGLASEAWMPIALVAIVAFLGFVVDCIVHPREADDNKILFYADEMEDEDYLKARYGV